VRRPDAHGRAISFVRIRGHEERVGKLLYGV
jgi:hypothetical protein